MLPTTPTAPVFDLEQALILLYGPSKIGKSTVASQANGALFLATEPGLNALNVFQVPIGNWEDFIKACGDIAKGDHEFKTVVLDTVDNAKSMCSSYVCSREGITHESELDYGKGWSLVSSEFRRVINKLALLPYGLILISHSRVIEVKTRTGSLTRIVPTLPDKDREFVTGLVDMILFCDIDTSTDDDGEQVETRVIRTKPSVHFDAGDRYNRLPDTIPMNYEAIRQAFTPVEGKE